MGARGLMIGLVDNNYDRYMDCTFPMLGLIDNVDFAVTTQEVGQRKPHPDMFEKARQRALTCAGLRNFGWSELAFADMLHIGNDLKGDFAGPRKLGMRSLLLDRTGEIS